MTTSSLDTIKAREESLLCRTYGRYPVSIASGKGSRVTDLDGPFDDQRDVGFFQPAPAEVSRVTLSPGTFALLFPWDAHLPAIAVDGVPAPLRKCVGKIPFESLRLS